MTAKRTVVPPVAKKVERVEDSQPGTRRAEKVSEVVARSIVHDIAARDLKPGAMLPSESVMLARYKVGRASLREGLRILEIQGLITIKPGPGGGPVVADANSADFGRMAALHYHAARATFRELVDARLVIEPLMAGLAAETKDPETIGQLRALSAVTRDGLDEDAKYVEGTRGFHSVIASASGNRVLSLFARSLQDLYSERIGGGRMFPHDAREQVQHDHDAIIKAIETGNAKTATRLMRDHMQELADLAEQRYPGLLDEVVDWR